MSGIQPKIKKKGLVNQKDRMAELKKLMVFYREITETIREPFLILDKDLFVVSANLAFYRKFKVLKKDTEGRRMYELGDNQWDALELRELLERILPKRRVLNNYEITLDFPTLGRKVMLLNARQVDSKQLILLAIEDVTALKMLETDTRKSTANLIEQRDRLQGLNDAKDEFIMLASHQLRTPATVVKQYTGLLTQNYAGKISKDQRKMLNIVNESNERQLEIIDDLLRVAKVDAGKVYLEKSPCDVAEQAEAVIKGQAILFKERDQTVILNKPTKSVVAFMDKRLMRMVLDNLLDNAGKYSPPGTQVTIDIFQNNSYTAMSITDQGVGIRNIDHSRLFKKFSRIDNPFTLSVKGTGLGLYWAKKIVDLHQGSIEMKSTVKSGSTFLIKIPIETDKPPKRKLIK